VPFSSPTAAAARCPQPDGYSLGFKVPPPPLSTEVKPEPEPPTPTGRLVKVAYDRGEQLNRCKIILESVLPVFDDPNTAHAIVEIGSHPFSGYAAIRKELIDILVEEIAAFKSEDFESEKEWRMVVRQRVRLKQGNDNGSGIPNPIHSHKVSGIDTPYVKLIPFDVSKKIPIASIRFGPTNKKMSNKVEIETLLRTNGFTDVELLDSKIPLRS
jgi:hypothetical protein